MFNEILDVFDLGGTVVTILDFGFDLIGDITDQLFLLRPDLLIKVGEG